MATTTSDMVISKARTFATETQFRQETGFTDTVEFTSADIVRKLTEATEKIKRDAFVAVRLEFATKDSNNRYFVSRRWLANAYGDNISHGVITPLDLRIWESDETSSVSSAFFLQGSRINRLINQLPTEAIATFDSINGYFTLASGYPTSSSYRIFVDYWIAGKPLREILYELRIANILWAQALILEEKKGKRMKNGVISLSQGGRTITRSEQEFDAYLRQIYNAYHSLCNWFKPVYDKSVKIGRFAETSHAYFPKYGRLNW